MNQRIVRFFLASVLLSAVLVQPTPAESQALDGWFGTWVLNISKSIYQPGPPPYTRASYAIEPWNGGVKVTYDMVYPRGGTTHMEWTGKFDGTPYPLQGVDEYVTYAYTRIEDHTYDVELRIDDRLAGVSRVTLSSDGKSITTATRGRDATGRTVTTTTVYERQ
ncbi:MAG TPA: hypothetical protein VKB50_23355 [Vicinamibacterales bacterium]|nr:hypothetical protein [Vicinamibacterales bacterium]